MRTRNGPILVRQGTVPLNCLTVTREPLKLAIFPMQCINLRLLTSNPSLSSMHQPRGQRYGLISSHDLLYRNFALLLRICTTLFTAKARKVNIRLRYSDWLIEFHLLTDRMSASFPEVALAWIAWYSWSLFQTLMFTGSRRWQLLSCSFCPWLYWYHLNWLIAYPHS